MGVYAGKIMIFAGKCRLILKSCQQFEHMIKSLIKDKMKCRLLSRKE